MVAFALVAALAATAAVTRYQLDWNDKYFIANALRSVYWNRSRNFVKPLVIGFATAAFALAGILIVHGFFAGLLWLGTRAWRKCGTF